MRFLKWLGVVVVVEIGDLIFFWFDGLFAYILLMKKCIMFLVGETTSYVVT